MVIVFVNVHLPDPVECVQVSCFSSFNLFPGGFRSAVDNLVYGREVCTVMEGAVGCEEGIMGIVDEADGIILDSLKLVEAGKRTRVEWYAWICDDGENE